MYRFRKVNSVNFLSLGGVYRLRKKRLKWRLKDFQKNAVSLKLYSRPEYYGVGMLSREEMIGMPFAGLSRQTIEKFIKT